MSIISNEWDSKAAARSALRAHRRALPSSERTATAQNLAATVMEHFGTTSAPAEKVMVAGYLDIPPEPPVLDLLSRLHAAGHPIVVPVCEAECRLSWVDWFPGVPVTRSRYGPLLEPVGPRRPVEALPELRLILVPALAIDRRGNRIGQGGGYYDRMLAGLRAGNSSADLVGMIYDHELLPEGSFPVEPFDVPIPAVFTPSGFHRLSLPGTALTRCRLSTRPCRVLKYLTITADPGGAQATRKIAQEDQCPHMPTPAKIASTRSTSSRIFPTTR